MPQKAEETTVHKQNLHTNNNIKIKVKKKKIKIKQNKIHTKSYSIYRDKVFFQPNIDK